jgi:hypothetical protein
MSLRKRSDAGTYQLVIRIPKELEAAYGGKKFITESLDGLTDLPWESSSSLK